MRFTLEEATNIVVTSMNDKGLPIGSNDVVIETETPNATGNYIEGICRVRHEFPNAHQPSVNSNNKIPAIKRLRELTGIGLSEAKHAVERPDEAITTWLRYGKYLTCN